MVTEEMLNCKLLSTQAVSMKDLYFSHVMEITNGQTWQSSRQNSVLWKGAKCHGQVDEFLLHKN
jgi:hypothetical protein